MGIELTVKGVSFDMDVQEVLFYLEIRNTSKSIVQIPEVYRTTTDTNARCVGNITFELKYLSNDSLPDCWIRASQCVFRDDSQLIDLSPGGIYLFKADVMGYNFRRAGKYKIRFYPKESYAYSSLPDVSTDWFIIDVGERFRSYCGVR